MVGSDILILVRMFQDRIGCQVWIGWIYQVKEGWINLGRI